MFCSKCGEKNVGGASFCMKCGAPLGAGVPAGPGPGTGNTASFSQQAEKNLIKGVMDLVNGFCVGFVSVVMWPIRIDFKIVKDMCDSEEREE